jgi:hypothetical protein
MTHSHPHPHFRPDEPATQSVFLLDFLLDRRELRILEHATACGGCGSISGLAVEDMVQAASVALMLQWRGLVRAKTRFTQGVPGQPEFVSYELTDAGVRHLATAPSAA